MSADNTDIIITNKTWDIITFKKHASIRRKKIAALRNMDEACKVAAKEAERAEIFKQKEAMKRRHNNYMLK